MTAPAPVAVDEAALWAEIRLRNYRADPWLWIRDCVWTVDGM